MKILVSMRSVSLSLSNLFLKNYVSVYGALVLKEQCFLKLSSAHPIFILSSLAKLKLLFSFRLAF